MSLDIKPFSSNISIQDNYIALKNNIDTNNKTPVSNINNPAHTSADATKIVTAANSTKPLYERTVEWIKFILLSIFTAGIYTIHYFIKRTSNPQDANRAQTLNLSANGEEIQKTTPEPKGGQGNITIETSPSQLEETQQTEENSDIYKNMPVLMTLEEIEASEIKEIQRTTSEPKGGQGNITIETSPSQLEETQQTEENSDIYKNMPPHIPLKEILASQDNKHNI